MPPFLGGVNDLEEVFMKNSITWRIISFVLIAGLALIINACTDEPEGAQERELTGGVTIPDTVFLGDTVTANTSNLIGSSALSYVWEHSDSDDPESFTAIDGETEASITLTEQADIIEAGRFIRVVVTRRNFLGSQTSQPAQIFNAGDITIISVEVSADVTEVAPGQTYDLDVTVIHNNTENPGLFQDITWEISPRTAGAGYLTHITADNVLHVGSDIWTDKLIITAKSDLDTTVTSTPLELDVTLGFDVHLVTLGGEFPIQALRENVNNQSFLSTTTPKEGVTANPMADGAVAYFIRDAVVNIGTTVTSTSTITVRFGFSSWVDLSGYTRMAVDMAADNRSVMDLINGFYPRVIGTGGQGGGSARWNRNITFAHFNQALQTSPPAFATLEVPLTATVYIMGPFASAGHPNQAGCSNTHPANCIPVHVDQVLSHIVTVLLEFSLEERLTEAPAAHNLYFRNLRFYKD